MDRVIPTIFIGLVTHRGSRFTQAGTPVGLAPNLHAILEGNGIHSTLVIEAQDLAIDSGIQFNNVDVNDSIRAELRTETNWRTYLDPKISPMYLRLFMGMRTVYRQIKFRGTNGTRMLMRLANIEFAHMSLMKAGLESQAEWILIVEDDAQSADAKDLAHNLTQAMRTMELSSQPLFINLSESFSLERLKSESMLTEVQAWSENPSSLATMYSSSKPFTNTVCAILYRRSFLLDLYGRMSGIPLKPVIPIDWKVNAAIMDLVASNLLGTGDCWTVVPGPILQGSMKSL